MSTELFEQGLSPGLQRARAPFRTRNAITGSLIGLFVAGVYVYSIRAVQQDNFQELDEEAKALLQARMSDATVKPGSDTTADPTSRKV